LNKSKRRGKDIRENLVGNARPLPMVVQRKNLAGDEELFEFAMQDWA
jgi:hypothetical protein